jgi:hypothetical protein
MIYVLDICGCESYTKFLMMLNLGKKSFIIWLSFTHTNSNRLRNNFFKIILSKLFSIKLLQPGFPRSHNQKFRSRHSKEVMLFYLPYFLG